MNPAARPGPGAPKIFGIGLSRTGTTSLASALTRLGFPAVHYPTDMSDIEAHAAATDISVVAMCRDLDRRFPESRFILTDRALEPWLASCAKHWSRNASAPTRDAFVRRVEELVYCGVGFDRARFTAMRDQHLAAAQSYFGGRPGCLLHLDLFSDPDPWRPLCEFLGVPKPNVPFPRENSSAAVDRLLRRILTVSEDLAAAAQLTGVDMVYLDRLRDAAEDAPGSVALEPGFQIKRILRSAVAGLGRDAVAALLECNPQTLGSYLDDDLP